ncbi:glycoside hydrolase family 113 [Clostridium sp.]|uniref:glycoside hydrolase family 113 n=1 Tax=Clostridium sp. TaxID=1506 RepID=UPI00283F1987|nr:hydrolase [Clostridium sp.]MDR3594474.1 hydrolase [Clostridium sp.]
MTKKRAILIIILISILSSAYYAYNLNVNSRGYINEMINKIEGKTLNLKFDTKIKSGNLSTDYNIDQVLKDIDKLQLNTLNIPVVINIDTRTSSNMSIESWSENRAIELIKKLRFKKINIIIEPYPWIENGSVGETEWKPDNINNFFYSWKTNVLGKLIKDVAVPYHVDALNAGTSFVYMESDEDNMCDMIDYVRERYKGLVTYRTNFWVTAADFAPEYTEKYKAKLNNKVFSKVDFISIASYFELTENDTNTTEYLTKALQSTTKFNRKQNIKQEIKNFNDKWNKPVFFGELGFPRTNKASVEPHNPLISNTLNNREQANCFEAYRNVFENEHWNLGFSVFAIGETSGDKRYYPSDESTEIIRSWYANR